MLPSKGWKLTEIYIEKTLRLSTTRVGFSELETLCRVSSTRAEGCNDNELLVYSDIARQ